MTLLQGQHGPAHIVGPLAFLEGRHRVQHKRRGLGEVQAFQFHAAIVRGHKGEQDRPVNGHAGDNAQLVVDVRAQRRNPQRRTDHTDARRVNAGTLQQTSTQWRDLFVLGVRLHNGRRAGK